MTAHDSLMTSSIMHQSQKTGLRENPWQEVRINTHLCHRGLEQSCMKTLIVEHRGARTEQVHSTVDQKWTIIEIASFVCPKYDLIVHLGHLTYCHNIACYRNSPQPNMPMKCMISS